MHSYITKKQLEEFDDIRKVILLIMKDAGISSIKLVPKKTKYIKSGSDINGKARHESQTQK